MEKSKQINKICKLGLCIMPYIAGCNNNPTNQKSGNEKDPKKVEEQKSPSGKSPKGDKKKEYSQSDLDKAIEKAKKEEVNKLSAIKSFLGDSKDGKPYEINWSAIGKSSEIKNLILEKDKEIKSTNAAVQELNEKRASLESTITVKESELNAKYKEIENLKKNAGETLINENNSLKSEIAKLKNEKVILDTELNDLKLNKSSLESEVANLKSKVTELESAITSLKSSGVSFDMKKFAENISKCDKDGIKYEKSNDQYVREYGFEIKLSELNKEIKLPIRKDIIDKIREIQEERFRLLIIEKLGYICEYVRKEIKNPIIPVLDLFIDKDFVDGMKEFEKDMIVYDFAVFVRNIVCNANKIKQAIDDFNKENSSPTPESKKKFIRALMILCENSRDDQDIFNKIKKMQKTIDDVEAEYDTYCSNATEGSKIKSFSANKNYIVNNIALRLQSKENEGFSGITFNGEFTKFDNALNNLSIEFRNPNLNNSTLGDKVCDSLAMLTLNVREETKQNIFDVVSIYGYHHDIIVSLLNNDSNCFNINEYNLSIVLEKLEKYSKGDETEKLTADEVFYIKSLDTENVFFDKVSAALHQIEGFPFGNVEEAKEKEFYENKDKLNNVVSIIKENIFESKCENFENESILSFRSKTKDLKNHLEVLVPNSEDTTTPDDSATATPDKTNAFVTLMLIKFSEKEGEEYAEIAYPNLCNAILKYLDTIYEVSEYSIYRSNKAIDKLTEFINNIGDEVGILEQLNKDRFTIKSILPILLENPQQVKEILTFGNYKNESNNIIYPIISIIDDKLDIDDFEKCYKEIVFLLENDTKNGNNEKQNLFSDLNKNKNDYGNRLEHVLVFLKVCTLPENVINQLLDTNTNNMGDNKIQLKESFFYKDARISEKIDLLVTLCNFNNEEIGKIDFSGMEISIDDIVISLLDCENVMKNYINIYKKSIVSSLLDRMKSIENIESAKSFVIEQYKEKIKYLGELSVNINFVSSNISELIILNPAILKVFVEVCKEKKSTNVSLDINNLLYELRVIDSKNEVKIKDVIKKNFEESEKQEIQNNENENYEEFEENEEKPIEADTITEQFKNYINILNNNKSYEKINKMVDDIAAMAGGPYFLSEYLNMIESIDFDEFDENNTKAILSNIKYSKNLILRILEKFPNCDWGKELFLFFSLQEMLIAEGKSVLRGLSGKEINNIPLSLLKSQIGLDLFKVLHSKLKLKDDGDDLDDESLNKIKAFINYLDKNKQNEDIDENIAAYHKLFIAIAVDKYSKNAKEYDEDVLSRINTLDRLLQTYFGVIKETLFGDNKECKENISDIFKDLDSYFPLDSAENFVAKVIFGVSSKIKKIIGIISKLHNLNIFEIFKHFENDNNIDINVYKFLIDSANFTENISADQIIQALQKEGSATSSAFEKNAEGEFTYKPKVGKKILTLENVKLALQDLLSETGKNFVEEKVEEAK